MTTTRLLLGGLKSLLPWRRPYMMSPLPVDPRYGYAVWMRHLATLAEVGHRGPFPTVVELGPGNSLATGIAAILSGTDHYIGLDVIHHIAHRSGATVVDAVDALFAAQTPIPDDRIYPRLRPTLESYALPTSVRDAFGDARERARRVAMVRHDVDGIAAGGDGGETLRYVVPWRPDSIAPNSVDLVMSQAVLQEVPHRRAGGALRQTIAAMARWLRPGGLASHQIDFGFYGMEPWNIHWSWSGPMWRIVRGRRDNFVNREPLSTYVALMDECGLRPVAIRPETADGVSVSMLADRFRLLPEPERRTRSAHLVVRKDG
jgi:hypothetical protein